MNIETNKLSFLKAQIQERISSINKNRKYYRSQAYTLNMLTATLAGVSSVLLGITEPGKFTSPEWCRITVLITTASISIANVYNTLNNSKELWVANNNALNRFRKLEFDIQMKEAGNEIIDLDQIESFINIYQDILDELNSNWKKNRITKSNSNNT